MMPSTSSPHANRDGGFGDDDKAFHGDDLARGPGERRGLAVAAGARRAHRDEDGRREEGADDPRLKAPATVAAAAEE
jgi:hypothetical protein